MEYETIIGLEVHAQMNTKTKLFCGCDNDAFGKMPNTTVCPICMGHPGTLPAPNCDATEKAARAAAALGCTLSNDHHFDRKNYFYPDLPMGYQISQYDFPIAKGGKIEFSPLTDHRSSSVRCRLTRLHVENDAGKLIHAAGRSYCDYNRAGTPLMEIVTEPDLRSAADAVLFAQELQRILRAVNASDADMEKGMMRFDASISLRPRGAEKLHPRSEIKNLNSFKSLERALIFEEKRLRKLWEGGTPQAREVTVHWNDEQGIGIIMREKESSADYRYFPEPDIPPLRLDKEAIRRAASEIGELPGERQSRYVADGLHTDQAMLLAGDFALATYFDVVAQAINDPKRAASIVLTQLMGFLKAAGKNFASGPSPDAVIALLAFIDKKIIGANAGKNILEKMVVTGKNAAEIIQEEKLGRVTDAKELEKTVRRAIEANPKAVADIHAGKEKAKAALIGFVMKETRGAAEPTEVQRMITEMLHTPKKS